MNHATPQQVKTQLLKTMEKMDAPGYLIEQCSYDFDNGIKGMRPECDAPLFKDSK